MVKRLAFRQYFAPFGKFASKMPLKENKVALQKVKFDGCKDFQRMSFVLFSSPQPQAVAADSTPSLSPVLSNVSSS